MKSATSVTRHTDGPWSLGDWEETIHDFPKRARSWHVQVWGFDEASAPAVATISSGRDDGNNGRIATAQANARLIAASPELLDACRTLIRYCSKRDGSRASNEDCLMTFVEDGSTLTECLDKAEAAIAKAEGPR